MQTWNKLPEDAIHKKSSFFKGSLKKGDRGPSVYKKEDPPFFAPLFLGMTSIPKKGGWEVHLIPPKKAGWAAVAPILFFLVFSLKKNSNFQNRIPEFGFAQGSFLCAAIG